jgi:NAD(P)-dependent dehydrogenase (short-subunit alcohol dehydrogenase family)
VTTTIAFGVWEKNGHKSQTVVVTGASAGLGRAIVRAFAQEGAHLGLGSF